MRLNGWQRLWVVLTVLWTLVVGLLMWDGWPSRPVQFISIFPSGAVDPSTATMPTIEYHDALAELARRTPPGSRPPLTIVTSEPLQPAVGDDVTTLMQSRVNAKGSVVAIPTVGTVRFPSSMSQDQVETASKKLYDEHQKLVQETNRNMLEDFHTRRVTAMKSAAAFWLFPPAFLYGFGWSVGWIRRGFQPATGGK
jgi:hypothetical protein